MSRARAIVPGILILLGLIYGLWLAWRWGVCRVYVPHDKVLVVIGKYGDPLPSDQVVVPKDQYARYKGIQEEVLGPGRYFINPVFYETELHPIVEIRAGNPEKWVWNETGQLVDPSSAPEIGLVTRKQGKVDPAAPEVVDAEFKGIQKAVLTPGQYKLNPYLFEVKKVPAVVIPPGSVGVMTRLFGESGAQESATLTEIVAQTRGPTTEPSENRRPRGPSRLVTGPNQRGVLPDVLQPGIYYLNPRLYKVDIMPVGYDEITIEHNRTDEEHPIRFLSADGYQVEADFTVVWGISPNDAPEIVANIGGWEVIERNVMRQAMISACQNEGSKYTAKELIQGLTRSKFQDDLSQSLERQVGSRNVHVLLALIRNVSVLDNTGKDATEGLLATIQRANIEIERQITNRQKTETEKKRAELDQASKLVDVARETVASETKVKVANLLADGRKRAAEIEGRKEVMVAEISLENAKLEAQRTAILGKAQADVDRLRNEAEAQGARMLIDAFGSPQAYNNYIFAKNFTPTDLRLIFAGPGTFWTDLKTFEQTGAAKIIQQEQSKQP
jgi:regulator of protease activity HflC (stomatin/prohibitin superfamily)